MSDSGGQNNSVYLSGGIYLKAPNGVYFQNVFTLTVWVNIIQGMKQSRIVDCGNGQQMDNVILSYNTSSSTNNLFYKIYAGSTLKGDVTPATPVMSDNQWYHLAVVLYANSTGALYLNGALTDTGSYTTDAINVTRDSCFVGNSNWGANGPTYARLRNLRIYDIGLSDSQIQTDMNS